MLDAFHVVTLIGHQNDKDVLQELDSPESDEESDIPEDDEPVLDPRLTTGDKVLATVRYTTRPGDFQVESQVYQC